MSARIVSPWPAHELPLAASGFTSYRLRGPFGWIMLAARDADEAMREAARSTSAPERSKLEVWNGAAYVPCAP